jgi:hypothetical protein
VSWRQKEIWSRAGKDFLVTVEHFTVEVREDSACYDSDQGHRWCVYAYVYPKHPHFARFEGPQMWQDAATSLPFHGGPSLLRWHYDDDKKPTSVQVGADYNHLHDGRFTRMATKDEAYAVFNDADALFERLSFAWPPA